MYGLTKATLTEAQICPSCGKPIPSGSTCYILNSGTSAEVVVCSKVCGIDYQNNWQLEEYV